MNKLIIAKKNTRFLYIININEPQRGQGTIFKYLQLKKNMNFK